MIYKTLHAVNYRSKQFIRLCMPGTLRQGAIYKTLYAWNSRNEQFIRLCMGIHLISQNGRNCAEINFSYLNVRLSLHLQYNSRMIQG